jgi:hypothetical protein
MQIGYFEFVCFYERYQLNLTIGKMEITHLG